MCRTFHTHTKPAGRGRRGETATTGCSRVRGGGDVRVPDPAVGVAASESPPAARPGAARGMGRPRRGRGSAPRRSRTRDEDTRDSGPRAWRDRRWQPRLGLWGLVGALGVNDPPPNSSQLWIPRRADRPGRVEAAALLTPAAPAGLHVQTRRFDAELCSQSLCLKRGRREAVAGSSGREGQGRPPTPRGAETGRARVDTPGGRGRPGRAGARVRAPCPHGPPRGGGNVGRREARPGCADSLSAALAHSPLRNCQRRGFPRGGHSLQPLHTPRAAAAASQNGGAHGGNSGRLLGPILWEILTTSKNSFDHHLYLSLWNHKHLEERNHSKHHFGVLRKKDNVEAIFRPVPDRVSSRKALPPFLSNTVGPAPLWGTWSCRACVEFLPLPWASTPTNPTGWVQGDHNCLNDGRKGEEYSSQSGQELNGNFSTYKLMSI
ncbi:uncharacterized protein LOC119247570 [Talpa occidentalis]|uniref:uncharacterized protein LOC119247570 n=1 Tax=Talpa occidentalis TaxID=50954 RepID=UPI0023F87A42|nr:uncharacterized protein LOC119247570 [Talpa occidentalis]